MRVLCAVEGRVFSLRGPLSSHPNAVPIWLFPPGGAATRTEEEPVSPNPRLLFIEGDACRGDGWWCCTGEGAHGGAPFTRPLREGGAACCSWSPLQAGHRLMWKACRKETTKLCSRLNPSSLCARSQESGVLPRRKVRCNPEDVVHSGVNIALGKDSDCGRATSRDWNLLGLTGASVQPKEVPIELFPPGGAWRPADAREVSGRATTLPGRARSARRGGFPWHQGNRKRSHLPIPHPPAQSDRPHEFCGGGAGRGVSRVEERPEDWSWMRCAWLMGVAMIEEGGVFGEFEFCIQKSTPQLRMCSEFPLIKDSL